MDFRGELLERKMFKSNLMDHIDGLGQDLTTQLGTLGILNVKFGIDAKRKLDLHGYTKRKINQKE
jgi:hypothetical protein